MEQEWHPCPCCGYLTQPFELSECDICDICFWQNDAQDLASALEPRGPNHVSLVEAQRNFAKFGACEERLAAHARKPGPDDTRDDGWRMFDPDRDLTRLPEDDEWGAFLEGPYYWRTSYWLRTTDAGNR